MPAATVLLMGLLSIVSLTVWHSALVIMVALVVVMVVGSLGLKRPPRRR
jgi:hypothetical protein